MNLVKLLVTKWRTKADFHAKPPSQTVSLAASVVVVPSAGAVTNALKTPEEFVLKFALAVAQQEST